MATFEEHIEGLTQVAITSSSAPTQDQLTQFLQEAIVDIANKMVQSKPDEAFKFAAESELTDDSGITVTGKILSVLREHDSTTILRVCTPIPSQLKYEATDVNSLHYRSKYNPGYYVENGKIFVRPSAGGGDNDLKVSQISHDIGSSGLVYSDNYNQGVVENFPLEYERLIAFYAAAMVCNSKANDIHNNMPTNPVAPIAPNFSIELVDLPEEPVFNFPEYKANLGGMSSALQREDFEAVDKQATIIDKASEAYTKNSERELNFYQKELEVFKAELERLTSNADRKTQIEATEYKSELEKYAGEISLFQAEVQEKITEYKWYASQYISFMEQYNSAFPSQRYKKKEQPREEE